MGIFKDMLYTGVRKREAQEEYERTHPRTTRTVYRAYCAKCGLVSAIRSSKSCAIGDLQCRSGKCGAYNHLAEVEEVE